GEYSPKARALAIANRPRAISPKPPAIKNSATTARILAIVRITLLQCFSDGVPPIGGSGLFHGEEGLYLGSAGDAAAEGAGEGVGHNGGRRAWLARLATFEDGRQQGLALPALGQPGADVVL